MWEPEPSRLPPMLPERRVYCEICGSELAIDDWVYTDEYGDILGCEECVAAVDGNNIDEHCPNKCGYDPDYDYTVYRRRRRYGLNNQQKVLGCEICVNVDEAQQVYQFDQYVEDIY